MGQSRAEIAQLKAAAENDDRDTRSYRLNLEINQKELHFLRTELKETKERLVAAEEKNVEFEEYKVKHKITDSVRRQAQMEIDHGVSFRHDAARVKSLEKELDRACALNGELRKQAKDKAVAIESERLWRDRVSRIQPRCDELEVENERLNGELNLGTAKIKRLETALSDMRAHECTQAEQLGQARADIGVERSRLQAAQAEIQELRNALKEKQKDISLTKTALQGNVDISALRDQIKTLESDKINLEDQLDEMKSRGAIRPGRTLQSYRYNPTHSRQRKNDIELDRLRRENAELKAGKEEGASSVEMEELQKKLNDETKLKENILKSAHTKIKAYRDVVTQVLGFDISSADGATYKFLSIYAQERSDSVAFTRQEEGEYTMHPATLFERPELRDLVAESETPVMMAKVTMELGSQETIML